MRAEGWWGFRDRGRGEERGQLTGWVHREESSGDARFGDQGEAN